MEEEQKGYEGERERVETEMEGYVRRSEGEGETRTILQQMERGREKLHNNDRTIMKAVR